MLVYNNVFFLVKFFAFILVKQVIRLLIKIKIKIVRLVFDTKLLSYLIEPNKVTSS